MNPDELSARQKRPVTSLPQSYSPARVSTTSPASIANNRSRSVSKRSWSGTSNPSGAPAAREFHPPPAAGEVAAMLELARRVLAEINSRLPLPPT